MLNFHAFLKPFLPFFVVIFQNVRAFLAFSSPKVRFKHFTFFDGAKCLKILRILGPKCLTTAMLNLIFFFLLFKSSSSGTRVSLYAAPMATHTRAISPQHFKGLPPKRFFFFFFEGYEEKLWSCEVLCEVSWWGEERAGSKEALE